MIEHVDPFIGTSVTDLPDPRGLAETWWWPKPQVGNTHPGATYPFGMVSACAYSGAYPTGYGLYHLSTEGVPSQLYDRQIASGFTHFQQSGTGAIRKYYNYFRVTPMLEEPLDNLGTTWELVDEHAEPGYYAATLSSGISCELTVGPEERRPSLHLPCAPGRPIGHRLLDGWPGHSVRRDGAAACPHRVPRAGRRSGRDRGGGSSARCARGVRRRRLASAAVVRPTADAGRHPARLRPDPAHHAAAVRLDVARSDRARPGARAAIRFLASRS